MDLLEAGDVAQVELSVYCAVSWIQVLWPELNLKRTGMRGYGR